MCPPTLCRGNHRTPALRPRGRRGERPASRVSPAPFGADSEALRRARRYRRVRARGGVAADASEAIGAQAYATGNDVALESAPDLHTAAHEAAHVVRP